MIKYHGKDNNICVDESCKICNLKILKITSLLNIVIKNQC